MKVVVEHQQSIYDLALCYYGSVEGIFLLMKDNPVLVPDLNTVLKPGTIAHITTAPINQQVVDYLKSKNIKPATGGVKIEGQVFVNVDENDTPIENIDGNLLIMRI